MPKPLLVLLLVVGSCLLLLAAAGAAGWHWLTSNRGRLESAGRVAKAEGMAYGKGNAAGDCVVEALRRGDACDGFVCEAQAQLFLKACLDVAPVARGLCAGVPPRDEIMASAMWAVARCRQAPHPDPQRCGRIIAGLQEHCGKLRAPSVPPSNRPEGAASGAAR